MRTLLVTTLVVLLTFSAGLAWAEPAQQVLVTPEAIVWKPGPPTIPAGAMIAVLSGDPTKPGPFVIRARLPAGYRLPAHVHPIDEYATVIQGTLMVGTGERISEAESTALPAGSFRVTPAGVPHYLWVKDETIFQVHGVGPGGITYIDPADDPRNTPR